MKTHSHDLEGVRIVDCTCDDYPRGLATCRLLTPWRVRLRAWWRRLFRRPGLTVRWQLPAHRGTELTPPGPTSWTRTRPPPTSIPGDGTPTLR